TMSVYPDRARWMCGGCQPRLGCVLTAGRMRRIIYQHERTQRDSASLVLRSPSAGTSMVRAKVSDEKSVKAAILGLLSKFSGQVSTSLQEGNGPSSWLS